MKKLHEIKIIYISKKKKKIPTREQVLEQEETEEFRDSLKTVSPTIGKDRLRIWKAWMDPITSQLSPSRGPPSSPEKHHRAPTRFTVCFHSKSKPGERPLERRSITRHNKHRCPLPSFPLCPRFVLFSPLFCRGDGKKGSSQQWSHESTTYDDGKRDRITWILLGIQTTICSIDESPKFPTNENKCQSINSWFLYHHSNSLFLPSCDKYNVSKRYLM